MTRLGASRRPVFVLLVVTVVFVLACGASRATPGRDAPTARPTTGVTGLERAVHELVNRHRSARHLAVLTPDPRISQEARRHSVAMAAGTTPFGHEGFDDRAQALRAAVPCSRVAENVASNLGHRDPAAEAVRGWLASPSHRGNIEGPYGRTGVGVARSASGEVFFTQLFCGG